MENFKKEETYKLNRHESHVTPTWDKDFNPVYKSFLVYNSDSTLYLDFDSHKWRLDQDGKLQMGVEQEMVLVDTKNKKTETILIYGPSFIVEDAYFKNDSILVLLENSSDNIPAYQEINLKNDSATYYAYKKKLFPSEYLKNRILSIYEDKL